MSLPYNYEILSHAKCLRKKATKQENHLWYDFLCNYPVRFQRQKVIDGFIADFYCHKAKIIIELDGSQHYTEEGLAYDIARSEILTRYGLRILRFSNHEVDTQFQAVCAAIHHEVKSSLSAQGEG